MVPCSWRTTADEQLSKKQFLEKGNTICKSSGKKISVIFEEAFAGFDENDQGSPEAIEAIESAVGQVVPIFRKTLRRLDALEGPPALEKKLDEVIELYHAALVGIEADPQAFIAEPGELLAKPEHRARKIGLECGDSDRSVS